MSRIRFFWRDDSAAAAAEFAMLTVPTFALVFGIIHLALAIYAGNRLSFAAEATARCAVVSENSEDAGASCSDAAASPPTKTEAYFNALYSGPAPIESFSITNDANCGMHVTATATYTINAVVAQKAVPLSAEACYPKP